MDDNEVSVKKSKMKKCSWSVNDKLTLLKALKQYGHRNIAIISKMLPEIPQARIKSMINALKQKSRTITTDDQSPINDWLQCTIFNPTETLLPQALLFIHLFETQYSESELQKYSEIYYLLYCVTIGQLQPELPKETKEAFYTALSQVVAEVWPNCESEILNVVKKTYGTKKGPRVYPGKQKSFQ